MIKIKQTIGFDRKSGLDRHPVKLTALLYLKEALLAERYEECLDVISTALEFGALRSEITALLEDPRRTPN